MEKKLKRKTIEHSGVRKVIYTLFTVLLVTCLILVTVLSDLSIFVIVFVPFRRQYIRHRRLIQN